MAARGVGDVRMRFMGRIRWGYGKISREVEGSFLVTLDLRWVMASN
jgi:hypothetical protein